MTPLIGLLFFLSGAVGLGYEIAWIKILALHFGNSAWSISAVVAAFMAGLGLGSWQAGRSQRLLKNPLRVYALLEFGIAAFGVLSIPIFSNIDLLLGPLYRVLENHAALFVLARLVIAFAILIVPTFLMGASLPVLVKALANRNDMDRAIGFLYGINTLGAAAGTLATGFFLLPHLGVRATLITLAGLGLLIGALAWKLSLTAESAGTRDTGKGGAETAPLAIYAAAFAGGALGIFYEVSWSRVLMPIIGSSTYAFSIILTTFLIGIGAGGLVAARLPFTGVAVGALAGIFIAIAALTSVAGLFVVNYLPDLFVGLSILAGQKWVLFFLAQSVLAGALMLLPTLCLGVTLPLCMAYLKESSQRANVALVGRVYAVNTVGSILGSLLAGFVFLPWIGVRWSILGISVAGLLLGLALLWRDAGFPRRAKQIATAWLAGTAVVLYAFNPMLDVTYLQRGFFRSMLAKPVIPEHRVSYLLYSRDGVTSTVTVFRSPDTTWLNVNGKTDASTNVDMASQYMLGHLPMMLHPAPESACIIGFGSGATVSAVAGYPLSRIDVVELEPAILETAPYFASANNNVLNDARVHVRIEDGRTFLKYRPERYDVIISEPSNPWVVGVASLFTREFYRSVKERLNDGGVFCQWIQDYELSAETRNGMLNTLADEFPYIHLFDQRGDLIAVASAQPLFFDSALIKKRLDETAIKASLKKINVANAFDLFLGYLASFPADRTLYPAAARNTDDNHWLEFRAPLEMYGGIAPGAHPLGMDVLFERIQTLMFPSLSLPQVAHGLAVSIGKLRPFASGEIALMRPLPAAALSELARLEKTAQARHVLTVDFQKALSQAQELIKEENPAEALLLMDPFLRGGLTEGSLHRVRGEALFNLRRLEESHASFEKALESNPDDYVSNSFYGVTHILAGNADEGERILRRAIELNPYFTPARANLGIQLIRTKRFAELERLTADSRKKLNAASFAEYIKVLGRIP